MDIKEYISSGIIESYVLGLATEEEVSILECVRKNSPEVQQAILDAQLLLEELASQEAIVPDDTLKAILWNRLTSSAAELENGPTSSENLLPEEKSIRQLPSKNVKPIWIAASVLLALSLGANVVLFVQRAHDQQNAARAIAIQEHAQKKLRAANERWQLIQHPSVRTITLQGVDKFPDGKVVVLWNMRTFDVFLAATNLPAAPSGKQYQLWAIVDGQPINAGMLPITTTESPLEMKRIPKAQAFAITLEKAGGSATPTLSEMYVMGNI
ncbi:anti-sigma factor [Sphingobacterium suaedae]|uniref:Anti-sigma factor domain-containing protein n=1 Tax=Sphingobacterium suaedae TaxID=1686402 RepID=A0ABW5KBL9_9SPHI